jgi:hypothetical protein
MTVRDILHHLRQVYGTELSHETVSRITDAVVEVVRGWQSRPLDPVWAVVFLDAIMVKVRDNWPAFRPTASLTWYRSPSSLTGRFSGSGAPDRLWPTPASSETCEGEITTSRWSSMTWCRSTPSSQGQSESTDTLSRRSNATASSVPVCTCASRRPSRGAGTWRVSRPAARGMSSGRPSTRSPDIAVPVVRADFHFRDTRRLGQRRRKDLDHWTPAQVSPRSLRSCCQAEDGEWPGSRHSGARAPPLWPDDCERASFPAVHVLDAQVPNAI